MTKFQTMLRAGVPFLAVGVLVAATGSSFAVFGETEQDRQARWQDLQKQIFAGKAVKTDDKAVQIGAPGVAVDAALVPISIDLADPKNVKALYLVIDDNPSPVAAHFTFGPEADPKTIKMRVRINAYTDMHAVAEMKDGSLVQTTRYIKASGGCSAPMGVSDEEALRGMGQMKVKVAGEFALQKPVETTLMVRHPNFNGMQMNNDTHAYAPARYIQTINVTYSDKQVFALDTDISLASNPVISFNLVPSVAKGDLKIDVKDNQDEKWSKTFSLPNVSN